VVVAAVGVSAVVVAVEIAADAVASNKTPASCSCRRGASTEASLHGLLCSSCLTFNLP
jgi:hypothetical protein